MRTRTHGTAASGRRLRSFDISALAGSCLLALASPAVWAQSATYPASMPAGAAASEPDSVLVCSACATVISVKSETRVARKGLGSVAGASLDSGVLGDQPEGRDINDTTNAPPGTSSAGLVMSRADRRLVDATVWTVVVQRRDGTTTSVQVPDDPVLRPGDLVTLDGTKLIQRKR